MYPRNNASPPTISVGSIYLIADGEIQTSGASVRVKTGSGAWGAGGGSLAYDATSGAITYTPTQAETNDEEFHVAVYKASCTTASITVVTSESATAGRVSLEAILGSKQSATDLKDFADTGYDPVTHKVQGVVLTDTLTTYTDNTPQTGDVYAALPTNFSDTSISVGGVVAASGDWNTVVPDAAGVVATFIGVAGANLTALATATGFATPTDVTDAVSAIEAYGDLAWLTATGFLDAAGVRTAIGLANANLDTQLADLPTVAEFEARTILAADYFIVGDYTSPLDAAGVRTALGLDAANLDTQLSALSDYVDCLPVTLDGNTFTSLPSVTVETNNDKTGYGLANDAITAAKFDELTAFPLKSDDTGATAVARTGADGDTLEDLSDEIAGIEVGSASVTFTPVSVTVSAGAITDNAITQYQNAAFGPFVFTIVDDNDAAVDLSESDLMFAVYDADDPGTILWSLTSDDGDITVGGASSNQVTVSADDTNTGTAGIYRYVLWDTTNDYVRARGVLTISREADNA